MLTAKHKTSQLIQVNKIPFQAKQKVVSVYKDRLKSKACVSVQLCIQALYTCVNAGYLPLKYKGYQKAWTLQNPYITRVPKSGIDVRVSLNNNFFIMFDRNIQEIRLV